MVRQLLGLMCLVSSVSASSALPPLTPLPGDTDRDPALFSAEPRIEFESLTHDFGGIIETETPRTTFAFRNVGNAPLEILSVKSTCRCVLPELEKRVYEPGESGAIVVGLAPKGNQDQMRRTIKVRSNDPDSPVTELRVNAMIDPMVRISPPILQFGATEKGESKSITVEVLGLRDGFEVREAVSQLPGVYSAKVVGASTKTIRTRTYNKYDIEVSVLPNAPAGQHSGMISLMTDSHSSEHLDLKSVVRVNGDLEWTPKRVNVGRVAPGADFTTEIVIRHRDSEPFRIKDFTSASGPEVTVEYEALDPKKRDSYRVTISGKAPSEGRAKTLLGMVTLLTDVPGEETVLIAYRGLINARASRAD